ncbi:MAG: CvpA family protein [Pseudomonadota bacterium]
MSLSVTFLDCLIVLVIIVSAGYAAWRGFLWETLTIFEWVAAAFACLYFGPYLIPMMRSLVSQFWLASVLAYAAVFLAVFIPLAFMSHRFSESVKNSPIGPLDRAAGVAFGVVRGLVIVGLAYLAYTYFNPIRQQPSWLTEAELLPVVQSTAQVLLTVVPDAPENVSYAPAPQEVRQAPSGVNVRVSTPPASTSAGPRASTGPDPMADLIRSNGNANRVSPATRAPVQQKSAGPAPKSYGATDRQGIEKLIETGGNRTR